MEFTKTEYIACVTGMAYRHADGIKYVTQGDPLYCKTFETKELAQAFVDKELASREVLQLPVAKVHRVPWAPQAVQIMQKRRAVKKALTDHLVIGFFY